MSSLIHVSAIQISPRRQRREHDEEAHRELVESLQRPAGLQNPVVVRREGNALFLVSGERRMRAMEEIWGMGLTFKHGGEEIPPFHAPFTDVAELGPLDAWEAELDENIRRRDLTWQERAHAETELLGLRRAQAQVSGQPRPGPGDIAGEVRGEDTPNTRASVTRSVVLANNLHRPEVRAAKSAKEAMQILQRQEERERNAELAERLGTEYLGSKHTLLNVDSTEWMAQAADAQFDVICTDPPYGMGADEFGDSGKAGTGIGEHFYDDSRDSVTALYQQCIFPQFFRLAKPDAHLYVFCDIDWFGWLKAGFTASGWDVFRTPLIWFKPSAFRAPWPQHGPQRKWEAILYAKKGDLKCTKLAGDVLQHSPDTNLGHQAQKAVSLFEDILSRSVRPGMKVFDPFCGSGPIFPAAHAVNGIATGIERDPAAFGIAAQRIEKLKEGEV